MKKILFLTFCIFCLNAQSQVALDSLSLVSYPDGMSDVWGFEKDGSEYAVALTRTGVSFVDVTNPIDPIELFFVEGVTSTWRDAKQYGDYVYVTNETGGGLRIFNLTNFPDELTHSTWIGGFFNGQPETMNEAHNIFIDEEGICYLIGYNYGPDVGGVMMVDLNVDPVSPPIVGIYDDGYVHDLYIRGDIMWTAEYFNGYFAAVDISDKANPTILAIQPSPDDATHNIWLSDDGQYAFVSDETGGGTISSWDISDLTDIQLLDQYYHNDPVQATPHNAFVKGNYLYISHYTAGVVILDISDPYNLTEILDYDTSPFYSGNAYQGCWGVYPYLPSGNIIATDRQKGLYVLGETENAPLAFEVDLKVILEGAYLGNGQMQNVLKENNLLPSRSPYGNFPYDFTYLNFIETLPENAVDWVLVEAREGTPASTGSRATITVETKVGLLLTNGSIVNPHQFSPLRFSNLVNGQDYYFCVRHRNHLDVLSGNSLTANSANPMVYDFTSDVNQAWGNNQQILTSDAYAVMHAGEYTQDGVIQITDYDVWQNLPAVLDIYENADGNLDGVIQTTDYDSWFSNKAKLGSVEIDF